MEAPPIVDCWQVSQRPPVCFDHVVDDEDDNYDDDGNDDDDGVASLIYASCVEIIF